MIRMGAFEEHANCSGFFANGKLIFIEQDCFVIPSHLFETYGDEVISLDLSYNCLLSISGIEKFRQLQELILDCNRLPDSTVFPLLPVLSTLSLNKNNISNLELLLHKLATKLPSLQYLSLLGNPACPDQLSDQSKDEEDYQRYRYYVIYYLPNLKFLDSKGVTDFERREAKLRGTFLKVIRPKKTMDSDTLHASHEEEFYTPLPSSRRRVGDHHGAYGKCRFRYSGKHSEGNRFIHNSDL